MLKKDKKKLESNLTFLTSESQKARNKVVGLEHRVREAERAKVEAVDDLALEKRMFNTTFSQLTTKLKNAEAELEHAHHRAEAASKEVEAAKREVEQMKIDVEV